MATATNQIWEAFSRRLRQFILGRVRDEHDADDVLQEVFAKIHKSVHTLKDQDKLWAWLSQIARHAIVDYYRKRTIVVDLVELPEEVAEESDEDHNRNAEIVSCLSPMIERLPEPYRTAIQLTDVQGLAQKEMADKLGLSLSGAKSRVQRGREKLKAMLLDCCHFEFDRLGNVLDYERKDGRCASCACGDADK